ncbi:hypothetical protein ANTRET_LOCUS10409 [Anthophora retusa]
MWFQRDGATSHTARDTIEMLKEIFPGRIVLRNSDIDWPPRSPDLTPPDFFLNSRNNTIQTYENVMKNVVGRAHICKTTRGSHLADIIFHI